MEWLETVALRARGAWTALLLVALAGCATPLPSVERAAIASIAIDGDEGTPIGRLVKASTPDGAHSGFRLMPLGSFSLDTRLLLAQRATVSLDVQYYHL
jgi:putative cardiolipin synthase